MSKVFPADSPPNTRTSVFLLWFIVSLLLKCRAKNKRCSTVSRNKKLSSATTGTMEDHQNYSKKPHSSRQVSYADQILKTREGKYARRQKALK
jgi:hypothetical protein